MRKLVFIFLTLILISCFSSPLDIQLPPYLKVIESTVMPPLIIQTLFGEYCKDIEKIEIVVVEGDKVEALRFWQQTLPSKGWQILLSTLPQEEQVTYAYSRGKDIFLIAQGANPRQLLLVEAKGVRDLGVLFGMIMKSLTNITASLTEEGKKDLQLPLIPPFPQAKLVVEARIPGKVISEKLRKEQAPGVAQMPPGKAPSSAQTTVKSTSVLQSILVNVKEIYFREFQLSSRVRPREVLNYYESRLREGGWQMVIKNIEPQPSFPYVLICALKGDYTIISLIPEYPTRAFHTLDEIILISEKQK